MQTNSSHAADWLKSAIEIHDSAARLYINGIIAALKDDRRQTRKMQHIAVHGKIIVEINTNNEYNVAHTNVMIQYKGDYEFIKLTELDVDTLKAILVFLTK